MQSASVVYNRIGSTLCVSVVATLLLPLVAGCASTSSSFQTESRSVAQQLGVPGCKVSVPIGKEMVVEDAKRLGNPRPEENQEWISMRASLQPGDELRVVDCLRSKERTYYYALTRNGSIVMRFYSSIFD